MLDIASGWQLCRSKSRTILGCLTRRGEEDSLGHLVREHWQVIVPFAPVHHVGSHPDYVVEARPCMGYLYVGEPHQPHPLVALAENLANTLARLIPHQSQNEVLEPLGEVLAAPLLRRRHTVHLAVVTTTFSR